MSYIWTFVAGYWTCWTIERAARAWLRTRRKPPTLYHRRQYRDRPVAGGEPFRDADMAEVGGIRYEHLGMTGEES
jgi:hypothetical protein